MSTRSGRSEAALATLTVYPEAARKPRRMARRFSWSRRPEWVGSCGTSGDLGPYGQLHAERRTLTQRRLDPNAPAVHLDDLSGNGETEPRATLGARVRAVDLAELLEDVLAFLQRNAGPGIADA